MTQLHWVGTDSTGGETTETTEVTMSADGCHVDGLVEGAVGVRYAIDTDASWATRTVRLATDSSSLVLFADGHGNWTEGDGRLLDRLAGAIDVDITATPLTNTLPIWRLGLGVGESADIVTAYIALPGLTVTADPQRYTRLDERSYRFESRDSDFHRDITVDDAGFVVDYPGLFRRA
ncbi:hypothetical protein GCM10027413_25740 [Conyzicola nivalis]|uniref:Glycolipid-binding domain-containing protein n=1 Tax=Conyzicola nivalis TaxID=1477021 RepID=A0A916WDZ4_9MICO|nr:putative glycolipid-binding domain-containing protein [Conyzicola nivalis]GGA89996.1 hypothetical protein GCM10010979_00870 [Conyzicola nivalis]